MNDKVTVWKIDTGEAQKSVNDLRKELKELRNTLLNTEQGTDEYNKALQRAADIQHELKEQMEEINASAMDFGQITSNVIKTVGSMTAGFQSAKAVMNLFGVENETVIKSLQRMQSLMAITQAIPALDEGVKAFKRLSIAIQAATGATSKFAKALVSTGLGAVVVALGLLVANWDKLVDKMREWNIIGARTAEILSGQHKSIEDLRKEAEAADKKLLDLVNAEKYEKLKDESKKAVDELRRENEKLALEQEKVINSQKANIEELYKQATKLSSWNYKTGIRPDEEEERQINIQKQALKAYETYYKTMIAENEKAIQKILDNENLYEDEAEKERKRKAEQRAEEYKKFWREVQIQLWDDSNKIAAEQGKSLQDELVEKGLDVKIPVPVEFVEEEEEEDAGLQRILNKAKEIIAHNEPLKSFVENLRQALETPEEQYDREQTALQEALDKKLIALEEFYELSDKLNKESISREMQRYSTLGYAVGDIFSNIGELCEEGSEEQKAFQVMGATINMLAGITAAISGAFTTKSGPWDIALAAVQAVAIATSGAATISKMLNTTKDNAKSQAISSTSLATLIAPVQYTQDVRGASIEGAIKDSRVFVVESDISRTQRKVSVTENEARF